MLTTRRIWQFKYGEAVERPPRKAVVSDGEDRSVEEDGYREGCVLTENIHYNGDVNIRSRSKGRYRRRRGYRARRTSRGSKRKRGKRAALVAKKGADRVERYRRSTSSAGGSSSLLWNARKAIPRERRIGIVENRYHKCDRESTRPLPISALAEHFSKLLEERKVRRRRRKRRRRRRRRRSRFEHESRDGCDTRSKNESKHRAITTNDGVDRTEVNERYDEFNATKMPAARSLSKSPQSDEGIEPDPEQRRGLVARGWSVDSTVPSDDETPCGTSRSERHKVRVTRCCSSDSAVLSDDDRNKGWENLNSRDGGESESNEGRPRYGRTPSVVVSDYSDYSYLDEKLERSDFDFEKYDGGDVGTPSRASSCSCLDCDEIREFNDVAPSLDLPQVCRHRRHSDSCCLCLRSTGSVSHSDGNRRNSCLASPSSYYPTTASSSRGAVEVGDKSTIGLLSIPPFRKISDCSTNSSLSGDECEVTELQPLLRFPRSSGWRKLRNIVQWTPFFQTYKKQRYPWVQLAGHQGNFRAGPTPGTILKKLCPQEEACFRLLMHDVLRPYVPEFKGVLDVRETEERGSNRDAGIEGSGTEVENEDKGTIVASYLQLQDLLGEFQDPCVMDCKVGVRTYLESELAKAKERPKLRKDMYEKMIQVDPTAPSAEERRLQGVTKPRYMVWRETISSTATLGFRVEGVKLAHGGSSKDFKTTRSKEQVTEALKRFVEGYHHAAPKYLQRLKAIRATLNASQFFATHEVVGSSLLFVHDTKNAGVWMIDFAKTLPLPQHLPSIRHDAEWQVGNHEDGYLIGVNNLIDIFEDIRNAET